MTVERALLGTTDATTADNYIEDVFSTYLYTGNGSTQTITNGINLSTKGGLVWIKQRTGTASHYLQDTNRGIAYTLSSDSASAQAGPFTGTVTSANSNGFSLGVSALLNGNGTTYASWTFRKQAKFFDVVTWTGDNASSRTIAHNLGSVPGMIIIKATGIAENWCVHHRSTGFSQYLSLNSTSAALTANRVTATTASNFTIAYNTETNSSTSSYVAYLFAHDAGGFGAADTDNVISCGSFTTDGSGNATVSLGYEPQWCMFKRSSASGNWTILDNMRGWPVGTNDSQLQANLSGAETSASNLSDPNATGFSVSGISASSTYIYIAIRRGPMRTPTSGTSVFNLSSTATAGAYPSIAPNKGTNECSDAFLLTQRTLTGSGGQPLFADRLRGLAQSATLLTAGATANTPRLTTASTDAEVSTGPVYLLTTGSYGINSSIDRSTMYGLKRAPGFFDEVCYTGTSVARTVNHNLGVAPELMLVKQRGGGNEWAVYVSKLNSPNNKALILNTSAGEALYTGLWQTPTATTFGFGNGFPSWGAVNNSPYNYVAYLFASCPGVSKVGNYTGTGTTKQIDCGFTGGARFVLIKRTDSTGDWYVWDTARGIIAGNDPYLLLNSTAAEVTNTDYIDPYAAGFEISSTAPAAINANGGAFIYLAIA